MTTIQVSAAAELATRLLGGVDERWQHSAGVARRAEELSHTVAPEDRELLIEAAWLHDIGYSPVLRRTGFHPLDGALYLDEHGWPRRLSALVAHHSGSGFVADQLGLRRQLDAFEREESPVSDALAYADQTTGVDGDPMPIDERIAEMLARHGDDSVQARVHYLRAPFLLAIAERVERLIVAAAARLSHGR